jgi:lysozyme
MKMQSFGSFDPSSAADFIAPFEGLRLKAYRCPAGVWTIGYGHTGGVVPGATITKSEARSLLIGDLRKTAEELAPYVSVTVTQNMFTALLSLAFNVGSLPRKFPRLMRNLNTKHYKEAALEFLDGDKANGKRLPGLTRRRRAESELFLDGYEEDEE